MQQSRVQCLLPSCLQLDVRETHNNKYGPHSRHTSAVALGTMAALLFLSALMLLVSGAPPPASMSASMRTGGYAATVGGGSLSDTLWIDLMSVPEIATTDPELSELRKIYDATEMGFKIEQSRHITVFMPSNNAIKKQLADALPELSYADLIEIFQAHILPEVVKASELSLGTRKRMGAMDGSKVLMDVKQAPPDETNVHGTGRQARQSRRVEVTLESDTGQQPTNTGVVQGKEIDNANGIAYMIDRVLLTPRMRARVAEAAARAAKKKQASGADGDDILPDAPDHIEQTNLHHWFYGRYGGAPIAAAQEPRPAADASGQESSIHDTGQDTDRDTVPSAVLNHERRQRLPERLGVLG